MKIKDKKGEIGYTEIIFILLNGIIFSFLLVFIYMSSTNALTYEQVYSKQIALIIDSGKPNMTVILDVSDGIKVAEKNKKNISQAFRINSDKKEVFVSLNKKGGYSFNYFSNYNVSLNVAEGKINIILK